MKREEFDTAACAQQHVLLCFEFVIFLASFHRDLYSEHMNIFFHVAEKKMYCKECGRLGHLILSPYFFTPWYLPSVPSTCLLLYNKVKSFIACNSFMSALLMH